MELGPFQKAKGNLEKFACLRFTFDIFSSQSLGNIGNNLCMPIEYTCTTRQRCRQRENSSISDRDDRNHD